MKKQDFENIYLNNNRDNIATIVEIWKMNTIDYGILGRKKSDDNTLAIFEMETFIVVIDRVISFIDKN